MIIYELSCFIIKSVKILSWDSIERMRFISDLLAVPRSAFISFLENAANLFHNLPIHWWIFLEVKLSMARNDFIKRSVIVEILKFLFLTIFDFDTDVTRRLSWSHQENFIALVRKNDDFSARNWVRKNADDRLKPSPRATATENYFLVFVKNVDALAKVNKLSFWSDNLKTLKKK